MINYIELCKPIGINEDLHKLDLYLPYNILATKNNKQFDFSIDVRDLAGRPDCRIGDFSNNIWFRPKHALKENWNGYKSYSDLSRAVKNCLVKRGFKIIGWYER